MGRSIGGTNFREYRNVALDVVAVGILRPIKLT